MTDILVTRDILGAAHPHGATSLVNLYAAMPSLHVAWAAWCAAAIVITTSGRWRHLAWLYPAATTLVVLASANHFLLDTAGGLAITGLGILAAGRATRLTWLSSAWRLSCALARRRQPGPDPERLPPGLAVATLTPSGQ